MTKLEDQLAGATYCGRVETTLKDYERDLERWMRDLKCDSAIVSFDSRCGVAIHLYRLPPMMIGEGI